MKSVKILLFSLCGVVLLTVHVTASPPDSLWMRIYGGSTLEEIRCLSETSDSGYVFTGYVSIAAPTSHTDVYAGRLAANGDTVWTTNFGGLANDRGYAIRETPDGGYVMAGSYTYVDDTSNMDVYLVKLNALGGIEWERLYGGTGYDEAYDVMVARGDSGFVVAGYTRSFGGYGSDAYLIRTDSAGDTLFTHHYDHTINDKAMSVCETVEGYVFCGHTQSATEYSLLLTKTTTHLEPVWTKGYGGAENDIGMCVRLVPEDFGFIVGGETASFGAGNADGWALRTDMNGDTLWTRTVGDTLYNRFFSVDVTQDGGYVLGGQYGSVPFTDRKFYAAKLDAAGALEWKGTYGFLGEQCVALSMEQTHDGGYVMGGYVRWTSTNDMDGLVIRLGEEDAGVGSATDEQAGAPMSFPNPSSGALRILFGADAGSRAECLIYDIGGRLVARVPSHKLDSGQCVSAWDGNDLAGTAAPPGVYLYRLMAGNKEIRGKTVLVR